MIAALPVLVALWIALSRTLDPVHVVAGVVVAILALLLQRLIFPKIDPFISSLSRRPHKLIVFLVSLLGRLIASTLYTSWLILSGRGVGRLMALPLRLKHPLGQFVLLNSVTLTPSTISLLVEGDVVYVHWLQSRKSTGDWRKIVESIEHRILDILPEATDAGD